MSYATNPLDGVRIHYEVEGSGPPLVLHVGFMGRLQNWYRNGMVDALRSDYQLILIDPRGQGRSGKPRDAESYALERFVDDVVAVQQDFGAERTHFLGYSMGGQIGFGAGVFAPDRFLSLILGGSHPYYSESSTALLPTPQEEAELLAQGMEAFVEEFEKKYGPLPQQVRDQLLDNDGAALAANMLARKSFPDLRDRLREIAIPTLIYCGTEDDDNFERARRASQAIPHAQFIPLDGLNHAFRRAEPVLPHIRAFLADVT
jgi:pimeloyl-ACP methyl ester carboxylesterase